MEIKKKELMSKNQWIVAYMPVYHAGWEKLLQKYPQVKNMVLLSHEQLRPWSPTHKDLHGLSAVRMKEILQNDGRFAQVKEANEAWVEERKKEKNNLELIAARQEGVKEWLEFNLGKELRIIEENIFVKWDKKLAVEQKVVSAQKGTREEIEFLGRILTEGEKSSDWWRRVGCGLILQNGEKIFTHNTHLPEEQTPYIRGDVRAQFHKGKNIELVSAIHAEALAVARAAKKGWPTEGSTLIVSDFPCPVCAKLIAAAGIKKVYFHRGYSMLDGEEILQGAGVIIVQI